MQTVSTSLTTIGATRPASVTWPWIDPARYPHQPRRFEIEGHGMSYVDEGQGRPVVLVHGTPSWSFEWRHAIAGLRDRHRCIAPDHLGFGLSDKPERAAYRPAHHARRLLALVRHLDLHDATLVVHDFGGPIGLWVAQQAPERFRNVVVVNSFMWDLRDDRRVARISRFVASPVGRFLYRYLNASPRLLLPACFADRSKLTRAIHQHYLRPFSDRRQRTAPWVLGCELSGSGDFYAALWANRAALPPVTDLIWGMRDPTFDGRALGRFADAFPTARITQIDGAGHFPQEEAPEAFVAALGEAAS